MLQRSPSYITGLPAKDPLVSLIRKVLPARYADPAIRWFKALSTQASYVISRKRPDLMRKIIRKMTVSMLPDGYDVDTHFKPSYDPWDQRLCVAPDGDLFRAITEGSVSVVTDHVDTFTATGIRTRSGQELPADIVVTATGLELLFIGGIHVSVDGEPVELPEKMTYKGMMLEGVPNLALAIGYTNASWTLKCDLTCEYVTRLLNHLHGAGLRQCTPRNRGATISTEPLLGLTAGYMQRSAAAFPKQGSADPWRVHQSYLRDHRALRRSDIADGVMQFTNPAPTTEAPERSLVATR
jgi:monooxygenase